MERTIGVAVRDGDELFLWIRLRRSIRSEIFYAFPTGRGQLENKKWNPHGSLHKDGRLHHKSFDRKLFRQKYQPPDANFKGSINLISRATASDEPRAFGIICDPAKFSDVMEVEVSKLSSNKYETYISVDLTEPGGPPSINTSDGQILDQRTFDDSIPWILVSVVFKPMP